MERTRRQFVGGAAGASAVGMDETSTSQWDVRTHDGEWRIYAAGMN